MGACQDASRLFADPLTACAVCLAESSGNPNANNGADFGLFAIEASAHPDFDMSRWNDASYNVQYAAQLQMSSGWGPWTTFTSGRYRAFLGQCGGAAVAAPPATAGGATGQGVAVLGGLLLAFYLALNVVGAL